MAMQCDRFFSRQKICLATKEWTSRRPTLKRVSNLVWSFVIFSENNIQLQKGARGVARSAGQCTLFRRQHAHIKNRWQQRGENDRPTKSTYTDNGMPSTGTEELVGVCYADLVLRWETLVPGILVGYLLCRGLCSLRFSTRLVQCYVTAVAYLCAAVATAVFMDAAMISARPTGYRWCTVAHRLAVPLFQRTFVTSAVIVLAGAILGWVGGNALDVIAVAIIRGLQPRVWNDMRRQSPDHSQHNL